METERGLSYKFEIKRDVLFRVFEWQENWRSGKLYFHHTTGQGYEFGTRSYRWRSCVYQEDKRQDKDKLLLALHNYFTGHIGGNRQVQTDEDKLERIKNADPPNTKEEVRSFFGLTGYYRKFYASYVEIAAALTDMTKKGMANNIV